MSQEKARSDTHPPCHDLPHVLQGNTFVTTIRQSGGSRVLNVTRILPRDWSLIQVNLVTQAEDDVVVLRFKRLKIS